MLERYGKRKARNITAADVEALRDAMLTGGRRVGQKGAPLGARSVRLTMGRLDAAFTLAIARGKLAANPCATVTMRAYQKAERQTWSAEQVQAFLREAETHRLGAVLRLMVTGLRRGEIAGLRRDDFTTGTPGYAPAAAGYW